MRPSQTEQIRRTRYMTLMDEQARVIQAKTNLEHCWKMRNDDIRVWMKVHPVLTIDEVMRATGLSKPQIQRIIEKKEKR